MTVCVPTYNRSALLAETLDSVLRQDYTDFTVLVTDNGSTDATPEVVRAYAARDPRVRYHRNAENLGQFGNVGEGIRLANTDLWALLMDDDLWPPDFLGTAVAGLDRYPRAAFFSCYAYLATDRLAFNLGRQTLFGPFAFVDPVGPAVQHLDVSATAPLVAFMSLFHPSTFVGRTASARRHVPLYATANWGGDWLFSAQMALEGGLVFAPRLFVYARLHAGAEKTQRDKLGQRRIATYEVQGRIFDLLAARGLNTAPFWESVAQRLWPTAGWHVLNGGVLGPSASPAFAPLAARAFSGGAEAAVQRLRTHRRRRKRLKQSLAWLRGAMRFRV